VIGTIRNYLLVLLVFIYTEKAAAQHIEQCGHTAYIEYLESLSPGIKEHIDATFHQALAQSKQKNKTTQDTVHTIKVVFHIVYSNNLVNLNDSFVYSQLDIMNECFNRTNPDTIYTRAIFKPVAGDAGIQFELATEDPNGNPSNGIVRMQTVENTFGSINSSLANSDKVKLSSVGSVAWDTDKYLNIWVCDLSYNGIDRVLGYAYPPTGVNNWNGSNSFTTADKQGVVLHYKVVGKNNPSSLATGTKTAVHEVGHYLGLRHIWGDGGCNIDDYMDDTPIAGVANQFCNINTNTCFRTQQADMPDMIENYMDYTPGTCQNMFTNDQVAQMRSNLTMFRSGIFKTVIPQEPIVPVFPMGVFHSASSNELYVSLGTIADDDASSYSIQLVTPLGQVMYDAELPKKSYQAVKGIIGMQGAYIYYLLKDGEIIAKGKAVIGF
jgi:hypothetical protein